MAFEGMTDKSSEATRGGYAGIDVLKGILEGAELKPSKFERETSDGTKVQWNQVIVTIKDPVIISMKPGEDEIPELKDTFNIYMNYNKVGKASASANTWFAKQFMKSAEELQKKMGNADGGWKDFADKEVYLQQVRRVLFKDVEVDGWVFIDPADAGGVSDDDYVAELITGLNKQAALRKILTDNRANKNPIYKKSLTDGTIGEKLGLELNEEDVFVAKT